MVNVVVGLAVSAALTRTTTDVGKLDDLSAQQVDPGSPIAVAIGRTRLAGCVIYSSDLIETSSEEGGGCFSASSTVTYSYLIHLAVGICRGPIEAVEQIWANDELIWEETTATTAEAIVAASTAVYITTWCTAANVSGTEAVFGGDIWNWQVSDPWFSEAPVWNWSSADPSNWFYLVCADRATMQAIADNVTSTQSGIVTVTGYGDERDGDYIVGNFAVVAYAVVDLPGDLFGLPVTRSGVTYSVDDTGNAQGLLTSTAGEAEVSVNGYTPTSATSSAIRIYPGDEAQEPDAFLATQTGGVHPAYKGLAYAVFESFSLEEYGNAVPTFEFVVRTAETTIADAVRRVVTLAEMSLDADFNLTDIDTLTVDGYAGIATTSQTTGRGLLDQLALVADIDFVESGGKIVARRRSRTPVAVIIDGDLGAYEEDGEPGDPLPLKRSAEYDEPRDYILEFLDVDRDFDTNTAQARRGATTSNVVLSESTTLSLSADGAALAAERKLNATWSARSRYAVRLPRKYMRLEPGDRVVSQGVRYKIEDITYGNVIEATLSRELRPDITIAQAVVSSGSIAPQRIQTVSPSAITVLDMPLLPGETTERVVIGAAPLIPSGKWSGAVLAVDGASLATVSAPITTGQAVTALPPGPRHSFDRAATVRVTSSGSLTSVAEADLIAATRTNLVVIGSELIQFATATLVAAGTYDLSILLRGRGGTEGAIASHVAGEGFALVDKSLPALTIADHDVGVSRTVSAVSLGATSDTATSVVTRIAGYAFRPWSPAHVQGGRDAGGEWSITWVRRDRRDGLWLAYRDVGLSETVEAYELDILDGAGAVRRTIAAATPAALYSAAQQVADFGSPQTSLSLALYQLSTVVGRGYPATETIHG